MAGKRDIEIIRGDDYVHVVTIQNRNGTPVIITGRTYTAQLRAVPSQVVADGTFVVAVTDGPNGVLTISMEDAATTLLVPGCYKWALKQVAGTVKTTILRGKATVVTSPTV